MKTIACLFLFLASPLSHAVTRSNFLGFQMMLNIASRNYDGSIDGSPQRLYSDLNVPEQGSIMGPGKSLEVNPEKVLNLVCGKRAENNYQCSIIIHKSPYGRFQPGSAYIEFKGDMAQKVFEQFHSNGVEYSYKDEDGIVLIYSSPERFVIKYDAKGI